MEQPTFTSRTRELGRVNFPEFTAERIYMRAVCPKHGLPVDLARWQDTVDAMLEGIDVTGPVYLMVDQAPVRAGHTHRRPGAHVDGYWDPGLSCHGQSPWRHVPAQTPRHNVPAPRHRGMHTSGLHGGHRLECADELLILATDMLGCVAYVGEVDGTPGAGGDCAWLTKGLERVDFAPGRAWTGHALNLLHESIPHTRDGLRTVVRLNVPGVALVP